MQFAFKLHDKQQLRMVLDACASRTKSKSWDQFVKVVSRRACCDSDGEHGRHGKTDDKVEE